MAAATFEELVCRGINGWCYVVAKNSQMHVGDSHTNWRKISRVRDNVNARRFEAKADVPKMSLQADGMGITPQHRHEHTNKSRNLQDVINHTAYVALSRRFCSLYGWARVTRPWVLENKMPVARCCVAWNRLWGFSARNPDNLNPGFLQRTLLEALDCTKWLSGAIQFLNVLLTVQLQKHIAHDNLLLFQFTTTYNQQQCFKIPVKYDGFVNICVGFCCNSTSVF